MYGMAMGRPWLSLTIAVHATLSPNIRQVGTYGKAVVRPDSYPVTRLSP